MNIYAKSSKEKNNGMSPVIGIIVVVAIAALVGTGALYATGFLGSASGSGLYARASTTSAGHMSTAVSTPPGSGGIIQVSIVSGAFLSSQAQHFVPQTITVVIGVNNTVEWTNQDSTAHTVTANNGAFNSGAIASGAIFKFTFTTPGTFQYHCSIHPFMTGTIIVVGSSGQVASGASGATTSQGSLNGHAY